MEILDNISQALQKGRVPLVSELVSKALADGISAQMILDEGLLTGMCEIGDKFSKNQVFVPEVMLAAKAMNAGTELLKPHMQSDIGAKGRVCLGTVKGDRHDIGKNLVRIMMDGAGLEVIDLGANVPAEKFVQTAIEKNCDIIACSALLTTTMNNMAQVVNACVEAGIRDKVKIMIGGAPVSLAYCEKIGADCYTDDAAQAAQAAVEFCKRKNEAAQG